MSDQNRRSRRQRFADDLNRDSWEQARVFRRVRSLLKLGQPGQALALAEHGRNVPRYGNMVRFQEEEENT